MNRSLRWILLVVLLAWTPWLLGIHTTASLASGSIIMLDSGSCPSGFSEVTASRGRYIVGVPLSGTLGAPAGTALTNLEVRVAGSHTHTTTMSSGSGTSLPRGSIGGGGDQNIGTSAVGTDTTPAPYIQLLLCKKT